MTVCVEQSVPVEPQVVEEKNHSNTNELVLDGGFVEPSNEATGGFDAPEVNAFGHTFRDYDAESERKKQVEEFYRLNHINQTYEFSAEAIRKDYPNEDWLHLTALIHDLGKVLLLPRFGELPQWAVVGDTHPLGCAFDESIVHHKYFKENPDINNPIYQTKNGIYEEGCGLENVTISWGHDDYMYLVAKENGTTLPPAGLVLSSLPFFYPMHSSGAYKHLMNDEDVENLKWVNIFNKYDLYSKSKSRVDIEKVKPYYLSLIKKSVLAYRGQWFVPPGAQERPKDTRGEGMVPKFLRNLCLIDSQELSTKIIINFAAHCRIRGREESHYSESKTPTARTEPRRRHGDRYSRSPSPHATVFKRLKKNRSHSPQPRPRKERGVFTRLGRKDPVTSERYDSRRRSPQAKRTEVETRSINKGKPLLVRLSNTRKVRTVKEVTGNLGQEGRNRTPMRTISITLGHVRKEISHYIRHFSLPRTRTHLFKTNDGSGGFRKIT
ncbi:inositol oxygenase 2 [Tanacetum coccineum]